MTKQKIIYNYDPYTKLFHSVGEADESPLEPGVFLIPANATEITPPVCNKHEALQFNEEKQEWKKIPNYIGVVYFVKDNLYGLFKKYQINEIGKIPPKDAIIPQTEHDVQKIVESNWRIEELRRTDYMILPDSPYNFFQKRKIKKYRKLVREWNNSKNFPNKSLRPRFPEL